VSTLRNAMVVLAALIASGSLRCAEPPWKPSKPIELIAPATPGGGYDTQARTLQRFLQEAKLVESPLIIINRPGAGGAIGWQSLNQSASDGHLIAVASTTLLTNEVLGIAALKHTDVTPIAIYATEYLIFTVRADSKIKSGKDLVDAMKQSPTSIKFATAPGPGNGNHILIGAVARAANVEVKQVPVVFFKSAAESATALLGGHVDCVVGSIPPVAQFLKNNSLRAIALAAPQRHSGMMASVPTWRDLGVDAVFLNWRGVVGPKQLSTQQITYWESTIEKLSKMPEWQKNIEESFQINDFSASRQTTTLWQKQIKQIQASMTQLGLTK